MQFSTALFTTPTVSNFPARACERNVKHHPPTARQSRAMHNNAPGEHQLTGFVSESAADFTGIRIQQINTVVHQMDLDTQKKAAMVGETNAAIHERTNRAFPNLVHRVDTSKSNMEPRVPFACAGFPSADHGYIHQRTESTGPARAR